MTESIQPLDTAKRSLWHPLALLRSCQQRITNARSSYLIYCFLIPAVMTYLLYLSMGHYPFGNGTVLVLDLNAQYVYFFEALRNLVHGDASLLYSFSRALGGEFMGIYAYYVASPLSYLVALFPTDRMLEALLVLFMLKSGLCGLSFGYYLHKHSKNVNRVMAVAFSCMYALCAYAVVQQNNTMWIDALIWLPLLTLGIEELIKHRRFKLFILSLALTLWSNYYIGYMVCIYVALYFFYYLFAEGDRSNPTGERMHRLRAFIRIAVCSAIGIAISAFVVLGAYYSLTFGKNSFSSPYWGLSDNFNVLDLFTKFLPGTYDTVRPEGLPFIYTGLLTLFLVPVYFMCRSFTSREKLASLGFIGVFFLSFITNPIDLIWHGFQHPNWLNYRYSFLLCFFLLVLAYKGFGSLRSVSEKFLLGIAAFLILFVAVCQKEEFPTYVESESKLLVFPTVLFSILVIITLLCLLCLLLRQRNVRKRESLCGVLASVIIVELFVSSITCMVQFNNDVLYSQYSSYNDFLKDARQITELVKTEDPAFYRMEKTAHRKVNDNMALGIRGLSNSTSTLNKETIDFLHLMGYTSKSHWSQYLGGNPVNDSLLGIRYVIDTHEGESSPLYYEKAYATEAYAAYRNPYALSMAYGVDSSLTDFDMLDHQSHFERLNALVGTMLGEEYAALFVPLSVDDPKVTDCNVGMAQNHVKYYVNGGPAAADGDETVYYGTVTYTVTTERDGELFFYAPSDYPRETLLRVNNISRGTYLGNDTNRIISLGVFEAGETVRVSLTMKETELYLRTGESYFYHLDTDAMASAFGALSQMPQFIIDDSSTDDHLTGTITTAEGTQTVMTTIPFDKGWHVYLDGEELPTYKVLNALIAFDIEGEGEHTLELKYRPAIYTVGFALSVIGTLAFLTMCVLEWIGRKVYRKRHPEASAVKDTPWTLPDFDEDALLLESTPPLPKKEARTPRQLFSKMKKRTASGVGDLESPAEEQAPEQENESNGGNN